MIGVYSLPGAQHHQAVELADQTKKTKAAFRAWVRWLRDQIGPLAPTEATVLSKEDAMKCVYHSGRKVYNLEIMPVVCHPDADVTPNPGWEVFVGPGFQLLRPIQ